jgi:hypothetical protein
MDLKATLAKLDELLATEPKTETMTKVQFETYVKAQLEKAKAEQTDEKDKEGKKKARKRLEHLRSTVEAIAKSVWEGTNSTQAIPVYNEPGLTNDKELSEKEIPLTGVSSMGNSAWAGEGGPNGFSKAIDDIGKTIDELGGKEGQQDAQTEGTPATGQQGPAYAWPSDIANTDFMKEGVAKSGSVWGKDNEQATK